MDHPSKQRRIMLGRSLEPIHRLLSQSAELEIPILCESGTGRSWTICCRIGCGQGFSEDEDVPFPKNGDSVPTAKICNYPPWCRYSLRAGFPLETFI